MERYGGSAPPAPPPCSCMRVFTSQIGFVSRLVMVPPSHAAYARCVAGSAPPPRDSASRRLHAS
jgi:hypothetical protein